jgi:hypothetical protein
MKICVIIYDTDGGHAAEIAENNETATQSLFETAVLYDN